MEQRVIPITFTFENGDSFSGAVQEWAIIHEALDHLLPHGYLNARRTTVRTPAGDLIFPDMFAGEVYDKYYAGQAACDLRVIAPPMQQKTGEWLNVGIDHVVLSVQDRQRARDFFVRGLQMQIMRDDPHMTVLASGVNALFFFDAEPGKPLTDGIPSRIHHIGFVVDDLEAAYTHLAQNFPYFVSDFTMLERIERWSMYGHLTLGEVTFMIQLSEIKPEFRGFPDPQEFTGIMYNYLSRQYGVRLKAGES